MPAEDIVRLRAEIPAWRSVREALLDELAEQTRKRRGGVAGLLWAAGDRTGRRPPRSGSDHTQQENKWE